LNRDEFAKIIGARCHRCPLESTIRTSAARL